MRERRGIYRVFVRKPEGNRQIRRPRHRWEDNIKVDLQEVGCGGTDLSDLVRSGDCNNEPSGSVKGGEILAENPLASQE